MVGVLRDEVAERDAAREAGDRDGDRERGFEDGLRIRLFDADRTDRLLSFEDALRAKPSERQLLWIDVDGDLPTARQTALTERFALDEATNRALLEPHRKPHVALYGKYFHVRLAAEPDAADPDNRRWLDVISGPNVVISRHPDRLAFLDAMDERIADDATIGALGSAEFVASLLDAVVTTYLAAVDAIEDDVDELDSKALRHDSLDELFEDLVAVRHRVSRLRRMLAEHRELFASIGRRDFAQATAAPDAEDFQAVAGRFETAVAAVEDTREVVLGSFDVLMTRTSQRTNDVMRVLTTATVLALPATVIAAFFGMSIPPPLDDDPGAFWVVVGVVLALEALIVVLARRRRWL